jgi:hypothetical protein
MSKFRANRQRVFLQTAMTVIGGKAIAPGALACEDFENPREGLS